MFQRFTSLFFGSEEVTPDLKGPKPCVSEADEEGWLLVNLHGEDGPEAASVACARPRSECHASQICGPSPPTCRNRRTRASRIQAAHPSFPSISSPPDPASFSHLESVEVNVFLSERGSSSCSDCSMDESWFVTPPPCFTAEGATAEASPMEDLLIEHPSMSVYVSAGPLPVEESTTSLAGSVSRMFESAVPAVTRSSMPTRVTRGAAAQAGALAKVTQVSRVQRAKARTERRHLARNRMQRQNRVREQVQWCATHTRNSFLHQPCQRNFCH
ncbi:tumor protein p53-inducible nuclear protein 2-like isoform X1 [Sinocyclocheilus anshuiensis]|uniref:tumor protein p53-inducible nuclear protein 2-like isoform X1 n=1 Tax=Sinocyclocheilus anshuiensis TaxID=1608454 RepID=UPI0007B9B883|nr:PREDICTED: tumor protein p53-inducible nuclear protein 2-like isoform X1 [Sinocyclocheilus anshuiensis]XP_016317536.1 PREDICTED: tumor protein p53-inducible nuclear protein 2-like isoform X1 [Sinocyclocheilus anshuiensis]XP_016317537.1 PREDICTED: tumor protein p53-inducible nuclear protein 2-like isoform X1 [Sinocyclocheilus anshuiensis]